MPSRPILEFQDIPRDVLLTLDDIQAINPHRDAMLQLSAVTHIDGESKLVVGYKDVTADEFWTSGHMPGNPIMPGVLMIEAAAQLGSIYCHQTGIFEGGGFIGLGGVDDVRYRGIVRPGERLWIVGRSGRVSRRIMPFEFQGFVEGRMMFEARIIGVPMERPAS